MNILSKLTTVIAVGVFLLSLGACSDGPKGEVTKKQAFVDSLIATMSLEAKVGEMTQLTLGTILQKENKTIIEPQHLDSSRAMQALVDYQVGSILNCGNHSHSPEKWHEFITGIQEHAARKASGIPVLYGVDAIHGPTYTSEAVLGPQQIGLAATWNESLVRKNAAATAEQVAACGNPHTVFLFLMVQSNAAAQSTNAAIHSDHYFYVNK